LKPESYSESVAPLLEPEDFEQVRHDLRKLVAENVLLRERIAQLEQHIMVHGWVDWVLH
jgi:hypothetical protein